MNQKIDAEIAIRNEIIAGLERENKIQDKMIKQLKSMITTLEHQNDELTKLLDPIFKK